MKILVETRGIQPTTAELPVSVLVIVTRLDCIFRLKVSLLSQNFRIRRRELRPRYINCIHLRNKVIIVKFPPDIPAHPSCDDEGEEEEDGEDDDGHHQP